MILKNFIIDNTKEAAFLQNKYQAKDEDQINGIKTGSASAEQIESWLSLYSVFRGINQEDRTEVSYAISNNLYEIKTKVALEDIGSTNDSFKYILSTLSDVKSRKWISAASKLLWCFDPHNKVIYDSYVERVLVVLQPIEDVLKKIDRIGNMPAYKGQESNVKLAEYYFRYSQLVKALYTKYELILEEQIERHQIAYPYKLRIFDKLLWMLGNKSWTQGKYLEKGTR